MSDLGATQRIYDSLVAHAEKRSQRKVLALRVHKGRWQVLLGGSSVWLNYQDAL